MTIVLVTNLVQQARRLADRTLFLLNGEPIEEGPTAPGVRRPRSDQRTDDYVERDFG